MELVFAARVTLAILVIAAIPAVARYVRERREDPLMVASEKADLLVDCIMTFLVTLGFAVLLFFVMALVFIALGGTL